MQRILFFDGICNLCNWTVQFILKHDKVGTMKFASLQSEFAQRTLPVGSTENLNSIVLLEGEKLHAASDAALRVARDLRFPWNLLGWFGWVPRPWRDRIYYWVARNRYQWFGKKDQCLMPAPHWRERFLDQDNAS